MLAEVVCIELVVEKGDPRRIRVWERGVLRRVMMADMVQSGCLRWVNWLNMLVWSDVDILA